MYSGRHPAITALIAAFSATTSVLRPGISPRTSWPWRPAAARVAAMEASDGGTTGRPAGHPASEYASISAAGSAASSISLIGSAETGRRSAAPDERHLRRHHREEQHVGVERQARHVDHRVGHRLHVHGGLRRSRTVGLGHATGHALGHGGGRVADIYLATRDIVLAAVER